MQGLPSAAERRLFLGQPTRDSTSAVTRAFSSGSSLRRSRNERTREAGLRGAKLRPADGCAIELRRTGAARSRAEGPATSLREKQPSAQGRLRAAAHACDVLFGLQPAEERTQQMRASARGGFGPPIAAPSSCGTRGRPAAERRRHRAFGREAALRQGACKGGAMVRRSGPKAPPVRQRTGMKSARSAAGRSFRRRRPACCVPSQAAAQRAFTLQTHAESNRRRTIRNPKRPRTFDRRLARNPANRSRAFDDEQPPSPYSSKNDAAFAVQGKGCVVRSNKPYPINRFVSVSGKTIHGRNCLASSKSMRA